MPVKITRTRVVFNPLSGEQMAAIGTTVLQSIKNRIHAGLDIKDSPVPPLKVGQLAQKGKAESYAQWKQAHALQGIRDLMLSGKTMNSLVVSKANTNRFTIECNNPNADRVLHMNQRIARNFGMAPTDLAVLNVQVKEALAKALQMKTEA
jgi:hypothetical protein